MPYRTKSYSRSVAGPKRARHRRENARRGNSNQRGYGYRWEQYTARFLGKANGRRRPCIACVDDFNDAYLVDHIIPVTQDPEQPEISGAKDSLFWNPANHQPLCRDHHTYKTHEWDDWFRENRVRLERGIKLKTRKGMEVFEIRNWVLSEAGLWVRGWFDLNPDPRFEMQVLSPA